MSALLSEHFLPFSILIDDPAWCVLSHRDYVKMFIDFNDRSVFPLSSSLVLESVWLWRTAGFLICILIYPLCFYTVRNVCYFLMRQINNRVFFALWWTLTFFLILDLTEFMLPLRQDVLHQRWYIPWYKLGCIAVILLVALGHCRQCCQWLLYGNSEVL